jgi:autotransporter-associated beta strand protein
MKTDDPKLTAYVLGELPPAERAEIEALLQDDIALTAEIEATRSLAAQLRSELQAEEGAPLSMERRGEVLAAANRPAASGVILPQRVWPQRLLKIAASLALFAVVAGLLFPALSGRKELARKSNAQVQERENRLVEEVSALRPSDPSFYLNGPKLASTGAGISGGGQFPGGSAPTNTDDGLKNVNSPASEKSLSLGVGLGAPALNPKPAATTITKSGSGTLVTDPGGFSDAHALHLGGAVGSKAGAAAPLEIPSDARGAITKSAGGSWTLTGSNTFAGRTTVTAETLGLEPAPEALFGDAFGAVADTESQLDEKRQQVDQLRREVQLLGQKLNEKQEDRRGLEARLKGLKTELEGFERDLSRQPLTGNTEAYDAITDNVFLSAKGQPLSTLSIDVDTASYANARRFITSGALPPKGAVRIEEMLNYFSYDYPQPAGDAPFSATMEVAACPWTPEHRLVRIGLKGRDVARSERPAANLVFLIDVSGSMDEPNKLPLVKQSLRLLVDQLDDRDQVSIAVYAGASGTVLEPTRDKAAMRAALDRLEAGGSTNGAGGIQLAYKLARKSFLKGGTNRVILATDGDFNVGITNPSDLVELIEREAKSGVFLSVLGYGMGNLKDSTLEKLADKGNGNYGYIDTLAEAKKTLVEQMNGTLFTIAKDVKIQVEFNPGQVGAYRLIGYENRLLAKEDFNNDKKDAGEIGAGHTVTALYEVVPAGGAVPGVTPPVDDLKYQPRSTSAASAPPASAKLKDDPGDSFVSAFQTVKRAEQAEQGGNFEQALAELHEAQTTFDQIAQSFPDWQPAVVAFRQKRTDEAIRRLEKQIPADLRASAKAASEKAAEPVGAEMTLAGIPAAAQSAISPELLTLKLRYKQPDGDVSKKLEFPLTDRGETWEKSSKDFRWAAAVASFGMLLRDSPHKGHTTWDSALELAREGKGDDTTGYRTECAALIEKARTIASGGAPLPR